MSGALVGVDLGGTSIRAAVATGPGTHAPPVHADTPAQDGPEAVLDAVAALARQAVGDRGVAGLAIGIPGPLDPQTGVVYDAPHLRGWHGVEAGRLLSERLGCPVAVHNDAKLATYAEWRHGAGAGTRDMIFVTVSTGIGGGMVVGGALQVGAAGTAGELGHVPVDRDGRCCSQGHIGCLEGLASGTSIAERVREALARGEPSSLSGPGQDTVDARQVTAAAGAGDALCRRIFDEAGRALGRAIGGFVNVFSPEVVVIGGGLINAGPLLFDPLRRALPEIGFAVALERCRVVTAALGTDAGLVGATAYALDHLGQTGG